MIGRKTKTTATKEEATPALVPKLRFPEFRGAKAWEEKRLGDEGELHSSLTGKAGADFDAGEARFVTYMNVFSNTFVDPKALRFVDVKDGENQNAVASGDVFFTISSETPDEVGMSSVLLEDLENCYLNSFCALFRFSGSKRPNPVFTGYLLRQPLVRAYFTKKAQGSTRFNLSKDAFRSLPLCLPSSAEQQKIAECLSSVDELMVAQARKVDALKTHKKGLMQQLFPREGETQPRLRFPEFQNAGEWEEQPFSDLCDIKHGYPFESEFFCNEGEYVLLTPGSFYEEGGYRDRGDKQKYFTGEIPRDYVLAEGDMLVAMTEQAAGLLGSPLIVPESDRFLHNQRLGLVARKPGVAWTNDFFFHIFNTQRVRKAIHDTASGAKVRHTSPTKIGEVVISAPTKLLEQQRIATCLSSLDALITAETQKHEALKTHKKGLMQQLFPSPEEVAG